MNAPGIIMAVGNMGAHLDLAADQLCTWLSRDGGLSWEDVFDGTGVYEFGDHGGLLIIAPHRGQFPATEVRFSIDEGACWHNVPLAEAIDVENIRSVMLSKGPRLTARWRPSFWGAWQKSMVPVLSDPGIPACSLADCEAMSQHDT